MILFVCFDSLTVCEECVFEYAGDCPFHLPLEVIEDKQVRFCADTVLIFVTWL